MFKIFNSYSQNIFKKNFAFCNFTTFFSQGVEGRRQAGEVLSAATEVSFWPVLPELAACVQATQPGRHVHGHRPHRRTAGLRSKILGYLFYQWKQTASLLCYTLVIFASVYFIFQGKDGVIFFLDIKDAFSPIGFIRAPSPVTTIHWSDLDEEGEGEESEAGLRLLVCCEDGTMMEVDSPIKEKHDTSKTYFLDPLKFTIRKFSTVKDKLRVSQQV